ncbi:MAG: exodeoxyribonuclease VII small subunit [Alphaproteobacteria bacterium]|nr:exodeoxyribonuclease VII small subunit [Alphaproteobacteria bacterium]
MSENELHELSFEDALQKLEILVRELEGGRIKLDDAVNAYEKAMSLKKICEEKLKNAQLKIEKLEISANGEMKTVPLDTQED